MLSREFEPTGRRFDPRRDRHSVGLPCTIECRTIERSMERSRRGGAACAGVRATVQFSSVQFSYFTVPPRAHPSTGSQSG